MILYVDGNGLLGFADRAPPGTLAICAGDGALYGAAARIAERIDGDGLRLSGTAMLGPYAQRHEAWLHAVHGFRQRLPHWLEPRP